MVKYNYKECHPLMSSMSKKDILKFLDESETLEFTKGQHIVNVRDEDTNLYLINSGSVRVTLFSNDGKDVSFIDIDTGGNFGEFSAIDGKPRSANVIALSDGEITVVPPNVFMTMLEKYPTACIAMLRQLTTIIRRLCDRIFEYSTLDVSNRIHLELLRLSKENLDLDGVARIINPPTQIEMASRVSCTREAVSREYKKLEKSGVIERAPKRLVIKDFNQLEELARTPTQKPFVA
jgi:CRP/FNR family cyclic AMP-dependent transcriptional regulator